MPMRADSMGTMCERVLSRRWQSKVRSSGIIGNAMATDEHERVRRKAKTRTSSHGAREREQLGTGVGIGGQREARASPKKRCSRERRSARNIKNG